MKALDKRNLRNLKKNFGKYFSIVILLIATISFGSGFLCVADSVYANLKENQKQCNLEDGNITLQEKVDFEELKDENTEVEIEENFYINLENDYTLRVYKVREKINKLSLFEGKMPSTKGEIVLDRAFAKSNGIGVNTQLTIQDNIFEVVGIVSAPDYNSLFKNNNDLMMNTKDFGVGFVDEETFEELEGRYNTKINYSYTGEIEDVKQIVTQNNLKLLEILPRESNQAITFVEEDMGSDIPMMKVLIYIVVVILAFVFVVISSNNIEEDAKSIGTLKALGYTKREIVLHYMKIPIILTLVGAVVGNVLGYTLLVKPFEDIYYTTYSLPPLNIQLNAEAFLLTTVIPVILMFCINDLMLRKKLNYKTINFLRKDISKKKAKQILLPTKLPFTTRFKMRTVIDNIWNFVTLFCGIYLASLLLLFAIGLDPIMQNYEKTIKETTVSEYQYLLNTPVEADGYPLTRYSMKTYSEIGKKDISVDFVGLGETDKYFQDIQLYDIDEGIVISDSLALKLKIEVGDVLNFKDEKTDKEYSFKVMDIYDYRSAFTVFMLQKDLNELLGLPDEYFNGYLSDEKLEIPEKAVIKEISREDIGNVAKQMLNSFEDMISLIVVFAVVIYLVLMYVLIKVIIERNTQNISLMKVMGYNLKEIKNMMLRGTSVTVLVMLIGVLPLEKLSIDWIMEYAMARVEGYLEFAIPLKVYLLTILTGFVTYVLINKLHVQKIQKISMGEVLKDRE